MGWSKLSSVCHKITLITRDADSNALFSFSTKEGSRWEKGTWPELARLAKDVPEAGIHFQGTFAVHIIYSPSDKERPQSSSPKPCHYSFYVPY